MPKRVSLVNPLRKNGAQMDMTRYVISREGILFLDADRGNLSFSLPFLSPHSGSGGTKGDKYGVLKPCFSFIYLKAQAWLAHSKVILEFQDTLAW